MISRSSASVRRFWHMTGQSLTKKISALPSQLHHTPFKLQPVCNIRRTICTANTLCATEDAITQQVMQYLQGGLTSRKLVNGQVKLLTACEKEVALPKDERSAKLELSSEDKAEIATFLPRYLITIAVDPYLNESDILKFFRLSALTSRPFMKDKIDFPDHFAMLAPKTEQILKHLSYEQLGDLANDLHLLSSQKMNMLTRLVNSVRAEFISRLDDLPFSQGIENFQFLLELFGNSFAKKSYYSVFQEYVLNHLDEVTEVDTIKLMHYCSLNRNIPHATLIEKMLSKVENSLDSMPFQSVAIVTDSVVKSGMKTCSDSVLEKISIHLQNRFSSDSESWTGLEKFGVSAILTLFRHTGYESEVLIQAIEAFVLTANNSQSGNCFDLETVPNFLAYLATKSYNREVFCVLERHLITLLEQVGPLSPSLYARVMWAFSSSNHVCSKELIRLVYDGLRMHKQLGYIDNNFMKFSDTVLSLVMLGHINYELCFMVLQPTTELSFKRYAGPMMMKLIARQETLRHILSIQAPDVQLPPPEEPPAPYRMLRPMAEPFDAWTELEPSSPQNNPPPQQKKRSHSFRSPPVPASTCDSDREMSRRPALQDVYWQLQRICCGGAQAKDVQAFDVSIDHPISSVKIASVCVRKGLYSTSALIHTPTAGERESLDETDLKLIEVIQNLKGDVSFEVLDEKYTLRDADRGRRLKGLMNLKLCLMDKLGWTSVLINASDVVQNAGHVKQLMLESASAVAARQADQSNTLLDR